MSEDLIAVLGPGGVGGLLAGLLQRADVPVVIVAREQTASAINERGLSVTSKRYGDFTTRPRAVARLQEPIAALLVATKAPALADSLERVAVDPPLVLPLLNGLDHLAYLRERYPRRAGGAERVLAGSIRVQAQRLAAGEILHAAPFVHIELACDDPAAAPRLRWLADTLAAAGTDVATPDSEAQVTWSKLVRLNALACATSAFDLPLGPIRSDPAMRAQLLGAVHEAAAVARAEGADVSAERIVAEIDGLPADAGTSMQRDIADGNSPELDAIPGAVLRAAARHGIETPATWSLVRLIVQRTGLPEPSVAPSASA